MKKIMFFLLSIFFILQMSKTPAHKKNIYNLTKKDIVFIENNIELLNNLDFYKSLDNIKLTNIKKNNDKKGVDKK